LALLNNQWVNEQSSAMARRVLALASEPGERVRHAWRLALSRDPTDKEMEAAMGHVAQMESQSGDEPKTIRPWESLCHVLLNTNEFIYVD
jgi:hypothetical protein